ncbi:MAG TPA: response regulator [Candidatus Bathyarchaeia archaeon]|nr:response regulator [Candidatus Bathyarchaeia archaeon]
MYYDTYSDKFSSLIANHFNPMSMSHFIARKNYDEKITTIHMSKVYDDTFSSKRKLIQQQVQKNKRILLVDDEHDVNLTIRLILEENGFNVDSFTDASQALENFTAGLYDLVLLDVKLPGMDGFSLYEKIRRLDDKVRICFLTATDRTYYYEILEKHYPSINENCVIYKPVDNESLLRLINSVL